MWSPRFARQNGDDTPAGAFANFRVTGAGGPSSCSTSSRRITYLNCGHEDVQGSVLSTYTGRDVTCRTSDVELEMKLLSEAYGDFKDAKVDSCVSATKGPCRGFLRSLSKRPPLASSVKNVCCAGDWVRMGDREHGAKGLCQNELVSGYEGRTIPLLESRME